MKTRDSQTSHLHLKRNNCTIAFSRHINHFSQRVALVLFEYELDLAKLAKLRREARSKIFPFLPLSFPSLLLQLQHFNPLSPCTLPISYRALAGTIECTGHPSSNQELSLSSSVSQDFSTTSTPIPTRSSKVSMRCHPGREVEVLVAHGLRPSPPTSAFPLFSPLFFPCFFPSPLPFFRLTSGAVRRSGPEWNSSSTSC